MSVEDLHGNFVGGTEVGVVIQGEIRVGVHGLGVLVVGGGQLKDVIFLDGILEHGG